MCGRRGCYCRSSSYGRWAVEVFPSYQKGRIEIARFECRKEDRTFSLLPVQLIPYHQYTVQAILGVVLLGLQGWEAGQEGCWHAMRQVEHDAEAITPWLVACWLWVVAKGLGRAHADLCLHYDLMGIGSEHQAQQPWARVAAYAEPLWGRDPPVWPGRISTVVAYYSHRTGRFLFGVASQHREKGCA